MNHFKTTSISLLTAGIGIFGCTPQEKEAQRPNFLVIMLDDQRPELNCYGNPWIISPNIDQLAAEGILFERAYAQVPVCGASRSSLLTGVRPTRDRFLEASSHADDDLPGHLSLPRYLRESGYTTYSLGKVYHDNYEDLPAWSYPPWRPMQSWTGIKGGEYLMPENLALGWAIERKTDQSGYKRPYPYEVGIGVDDSEYTDGQVTDAALAALRMLKDQGNPFFLAVGFRKPHLPFAAPEKYWNMYHADSIKLADNPYPPENAPPMSIHNWPELRGYYSVPPTGQVSPELERMLVHGYYACTSYLDALIGTLLSEVENLGLEDNTIICLFGDHGFNLNEHSMWAKHCNYEVSLRVPLIFRVPGIRGGTRSGSISELLDVYPTICELAGLDMPGHLQGTSLLPVFHDPEKSVKEYAYSRFKRGETVISRQYAYTEYLAPKSDNIVGRMLYDHLADPAENKNIVDSPELKDMINELSEKLIQVEKESQAVRMDAVPSDR